MKHKNLHLVNKNITSIYNFVFELLKVEYIPHILINVSLVNKDNFVSPIISYFQLMLRTLFNMYYSSDNAKYFFPN